MNKPPRRVDITDPTIRDAVEKLRGNTNVAMLQALGGEFIYDDAAADRARGHGIEMKALDETGRRWRLSIVRSKDRDR